MTLAELLRGATERLTVAGVGTPRVDAELLVADLFDVERRELALHLADAVDEDTAARLDEMVQRRANGEPLQHITGYAPFRHLLVQVGPGVFVPRPETELLVDEVLRHVRNVTTPVVVDLCSGSGAIAIAVAQESRGAEVVAVEADPVALDWLRRNASGTAVEVRPGDVTDPDLLADRRGAVDVVVCNPPYVPAGTDVAPEVRADPGIAVFAGDDGLALIPHVAARAAELLRPGGLLVMEHDDTHAQRVPALLAAGPWVDVADRTDLTGRPRFVVAVRR